MLVQKQIASEQVYKILKCSTKLEPQILYAIWERVIEENTQDLESVVNVAFLKESQFYLACKLVAIYQKNLASTGLSELLPADHLNKLIQNPLKYYADFDFTKLNEEEDALDSQAYTNPQEMREEMGKSEVMDSNAFNTCVVKQEEAKQQPVSYPSLNLGY